MLIKLRGPGCIPHRSWGRVRALFFFRSSLNLALEFCPLEKVGANSLVLKALGTTSPVSAPRVHPAAWRARASAHHPLLHPPLPLFSSTSFSKAQFNGEEPRWLRWAAGYEFWESGGGCLPISLACRRVKSALKHLGLVRRRARATALGGELGCSRHVSLCHVPGSSWGHPLGSVAGRAWGGAAQLLVIYRSEKYSLGRPSCHQSF